VAGSLGALVLTTILFVFVGHFLFRNTHVDHLVHLIPLGVVLRVAGQLGDLVLSSIKRDLGIKDLGMALPGHGGLLDRFDSLIVVAPAFYHSVGYQLGFGLDQQTRIIIGG
jgi:phosphatidate cytidylyltransferase